MFDGGAEQQKLSVVRVLELILGILGLVLLSFYASVKVDAYANSRAALAELRAEMPLPISDRKGTIVSASEPQAARASPADLKLRPSDRIVAFERFLDVNASRPIAVLQIPRLQLEVPLFKGTSKLALNRGVGWMESTAAPGQEGNIGIAGHRDTFFRGLRFLQRGDEILLITKRGTEFFRTNSTEVVRVDDTSVLKPGRGRSLTLVTCYPFYYVGRAPKRFVVKATLIRETRADGIEETAPQANGLR